MVTTKKQSLGGGASKKNGKEKMTKPKPPPKPKTTPIKKSTSSKKEIDLAELIYALSRRGPGGPVSIATGLGGPTVYARGVGRNSSDKGARKDVLHETDITAQCKRTIGQELFDSSSFNIPFENADFNDAAERNVLAFDPYSNGRRTYCWICGLPLGPRSPTHTKYNRDLAPQCEHLLPSSIAYSILGFDRTDSKHTLFAPNYSWAHAMCNTSKCKSKYDVGSNRFGIPLFFYFLGARIIPNKDAVGGMVWGIEPWKTASTDGLTNLYNTSELRAPEVTDDIFDNWLRKRQIRIFTTLEETVNTLQRTNELGRRLSLGFSAMLARAGEAGLPPSGPPPDITTSIFPPGSSAYYAVAGPSAPGSSAMHTAPGPSEEYMDDSENKGGGKARGNKTKKYKNKKRKSKKRKSKKRKSKKRKVKSGKVKKEKVKKTKKIIN